MKLRAPEELSGQTTKGDGPPHIAASRILAGRPGRPPQAGGLPHNFSRIVIQSEQCWVYSGFFATKTLSAIA
jgi:hypothetical protein